MVSVSKFARLLKGEEKREEGTLGYVEVSKYMISTCPLSV